LSWFQVAAMISFWCRQPAVVARRRPAAHLLRCEYVRSNGWASTKKMSLRLVDSASRAERKSK